MGRAKDNHAARLYWFTDLDQARAAARKSGKPILSLRLLGNLDEEFSCANSRFFRAVLYSDPRVAALLRDKFILHWKSVRPVPRVTIDFGDGRKLNRTLTGNSIHYVLESDGSLIDALPGLYGPTAFVRELERTLVERTARTPAASPRAQTVRTLVRPRSWSAYHATRAWEIATAWLNDLKRAQGTTAVRTASYVTPAGATQTRAPSGPAVTGHPTAQQAAPVAMAKRRIEAPLLAMPTAEDAAPLAATKMEAESPVLAALPAAIQAAPVAVTKAGIERPMLAGWDDAVAPLEHATDDAMWRELAAQRRADAELDPHAVRLIAEMSRATETCPHESVNKLPTEQQSGAGRVALDDAALARRLAKLTDLIALDTVRNEFLFHRRIHEWLAEDGGRDVDTFNERVYAELFLTPSSDPWLGLLSEDAFTALPADGVEMASRP